MEMKLIQIKHSKHQQKLTFPFSHLLQRLEILLYRCLQKEQKKCERHQHSLVMGESAPLPRQEVPCELMPMLVHDWSSLLWLYTSILLLYLLGGRAGLWN